jgi:hypothetical protein
LSTSVVPLSLLLPPLDVLNGLASTKGGGGGGPVVAVAVAVAPAVEDNYWRNQPETQALTVK